MADDKKKVEYRFIGDISSLKDATLGAINLLDQYQSKMKAISQSDAFKSNQQVANSVKSTISGIVKEVTNLQQKLKDVQDVKVFKGTAESNQLTSAMKTLQTQLDSLRNKNKVTTQDIQALVTALKNAKQSFHDVAPAVDNLVAKEQKFQEKLDSVRAKSEEVANRLRQVFGGIAQPFDGATSQLTSFSAKAAEALDNTKRMAEAAGSGFRQFKGDAAEAAAGEAAVAEGAAAMDPKIAVAIKAFQTFSKVVKALGKVLGTVAKGGFSLLKKAISSLIPKTKEASSSLLSLKNVLLGAGLGKAFVESAKSAMGYIENLNLFTVAMGDSIDEAMRFVSQMSEIYGMDPSNLYRYAGYFNQLTEAIGMTSEASKTVSLSLTKASNDIASLFNVEIEQVVENLASGMQGMSIAVRKYGIDIRKATLQQTALNYGFTENVSTTSEANRQALRYLTMMQQVKNATKQVTKTVDGVNTVMGDFARNIETPANQLRILKEQASQVARAFGTFFIPIMQKTLYVINGVLMAVKTLLQFLASLAGIDINSFGGEVSKGADDAADSVSGIGSAASKSAKELKKLIAPFDELTILTEPKDTSSSGASGLGSDTLDPKLLEAIENMQLGLDEVRMKALDVRDKILELLGLEYDGSNIKVVTDGLIDNLINLWNAGDYTGFGERIAEFFNLGIAWGIEHTDPAQYAPILNEKIRILAEVLNGLVSGLNWEGLGTIIGNGITLALGVVNTFLETFDFGALGSSFASGINGIVDAVDWELLGTTIGNYFRAKIEFGLNLISEIDWVSLGASLATGLNALINAVPWEDLGALFASLMSFIPNTIKGFIDGDPESGTPGFDFVALGENLGNGFMTMLNSVNWGDIGATLGKAVNGIGDTIRTFLANYEWGTIGSDLAQFFNGAIREINWHNAGKTVSDVTRALLREVITFLGELDWFSLGKGISEYILAIDWFGLLTDVIVGIITILGGVVRGLLGLIVGIFTGIGADIVDGFQGGIVDGLKNIGLWLWDNFVDPVIRAVKGFFGIHSPSKVFDGIGTNVVSGFLEGMLNSLKDIGGWLKEKLVDPVIDAVKGGFGFVGDVAQDFVGFGKGVINGLMSGLETVGSKLSTWGSGLLTSVQGIFNQISTSVNNTVNGIKRAASSISTTTSDMKKGVASGISNSVTSSFNSALSKSNINIPTPSTNAAKMATGGVVRRPTNAIIGEGAYDEAVIPLGNSPELAEMIDKIANAVSQTNGQSNSEQPIIVQVFIDSEEVTSRQNRTNRMYGRTQQKI